MFAGDQGGVLTVSIDVDTELDGRSHDPQKLAVLTDLLVELTTIHGLPVTWSVADPARSALTETLRSCPVAHEIAVLGDRAWVGRGAGRTRFARELARRVEGAQKSGLVVSTLALRHVELDENLDLLVKHRISVVRHSEPARREFVPRSLRFGVWEAPVSGRLPTKQNWLFGGLSGAARRVAQTVAFHGGFAHLVIDGPELSEYGHSGFRHAERMFQFLRQLRDSGQLSVVTLSTLAARLNQQSFRSRAA